jgi:transaldolase
MDLLEHERVPLVGDLRIKLFSDGADLDAIALAHTKGLVKGFTTNPTLLAKAGITNYLVFAQEVLRIVTDLPVSFEVFSDDFDEMQEQALTLSGLADNVYVKIPVTNTKGCTAAPLIGRLAARGLKLNVTAILSCRQVAEVVDALRADVPAIVSVFAGRVADTGRDPVPIVAQALAIARAKPAVEILWASTREPLNIIQADRIGCHIITVTPEILKRAELFGIDLETLSLRTVKMFHDDAVKSGFRIVEPS